MRVLSDFSVSAATAGFVAVLVGFTSSVAIVFQAALAFGATQAQLASWIWALGIGMGLCSLVPSWILRKPVMVAWSTPGAAVLASAGLAGSFGMADATGAFIACAALVTLCGVTGWFETIINRIPVSITSALLAGVLVRFGLQAFAAAQTAPALVTLMLASYLIARRTLPRFAVVLTLLAGLGLALARGEIAQMTFGSGLAAPVFVAPQWSGSAFVSLAIPLFVVTMASQNLPGVAAIRAAGYGGPAGVPISRLITLTGLTTLVLAPFGAFSLGFGAITAAICLGPEAHEDRHKRYTAAMFCGALYLLIAFLGAAVSGLLSAFPKELVAAIAGIALLGTIANAMAQALQDEAGREAAIITFLVTLSGVVIAGVGSAFWGVVAGGAAIAVQQYKRRTT